MVYVVLGMHKSGTTLLSRMLHASGINMGEDIDESIDYDAANHYERRATADINFALLRDCLASPLGTGRFFTGGRRLTTESGRRHHSLSRIRALPTCATPRDEARMRDVVAACSGVHADWGFKDPRTCLTYSLWQPHLGAHKVIGVYRGVRQVLQHYGAAGPGRVWLPRVYRVLETWTRYNTLLLDACTSPHVPALVVRYERLVEGDREMQHVSAFLNRVVPDVRQPEKYRGRAADDRALPRIAALLGRCCSASPRDLLFRLEALRLESIERLAGPAGASGAGEPAS